MTKRIQNRVAESRLQLPVVVGYGAGLWLLCGLLQQHWWVQFVCFLVSTYLMVELNNSNALIRIYSRSVSSAFVVLSGVACFLFPSMGGAIAQLCIVASLLTICHTYQDKASVGWTFYTFLFLGLASLIMVESLLLIPIYWVIMAILLYSLSGRTFAASLLGLLLPYWFLTAWTLWIREGDFSRVIAHFAQLGQIKIPADYTAVTIPQTLTFLFVVVLTAIGVVHYVRKSYNDKIRIRQIYYSLMVLNLSALVMVAIQPQHYDLMMRVAIITCSPLIAHFLSLTNTRTTNITFFVITAIALLLTLLHLWSSSFIS